MATNEQEVNKELQMVLYTPPRVDPAEAKKTLDKTNLTDEQIALLLNPNAMQSDSDALKGILTAQGRLRQVQQSMDNIMVSLRKNPSILSNLTETWGGLSFLEKLFGGITVSIPALLLGVALNVGSLLLLSGVSALTYTATGLVLADHKLHTDAINKKIQEGFLDMAVVLELAIMSLEAIRQVLSATVEQFKAENLRLEQLVTDFKDQTITLKNQIGIFVVSEELLRAQIEQSKNELAQFQESLSLTDQQLKARTDALINLENEHDKCVKRLTASTAELKSVQESMSLELSNVKQIASSLSGTLLALSDKEVSDKEQQDFTTRMSDFFREQSEILRANQQSTQLTQELTQAKEQLTQTNARFAAAVDYLEKERETLTEIAGVKPAQDRNAKTQILTKLGIFSHGNLNTSDLDPATAEALLRNP